MPNRGKNKLKLTIALAVTALALTGFAPERGGHGGHSGHSSHGGGGGGGCSSSHSDHDSSSSSNDYDGSSSSGSAYGDDDTYTDDDDTYGSSTSGGSYNRYPTHHSTSSPTGSSTDDLKDAKVRLVSCASESKPYATVQVTNDNERKGHFQVSVTFLDADGSVVSNTTEQVDVSGKGKKTSKIELAYPGDADSVDHCDVVPTATPYQ
ncbi:hypothetical protein [Streptomyces odontomachi]|uniref:hypothetical protein n=1 Tax=Streptomyces odontomachi TaxID=2944940 RepID=UPI00210D208B|nr:hypothetical protein [Streptomyces sp. ODS25]